MEDRRRLHTLVDELPEPELPAARRYLEYLQQTTDPLRRALEAAPPDDEPLTEDDSEAIREGYADRARGATTAHPELRRQLSKTG